MEPLARGARPDSYESHRRAARAIDEGRFEKEIVPIELDLPVARLRLDDARPDALRRRRSGAARDDARDDGCAPAGIRARREGDRGNSSQIVDGSAAVLVASEEKASALGLEPRARFLGFGIAGVDPHLMLHGNPRRGDGAREGRPHVGRHGGHRGERGVRLGRAAVPRRHELRERWEAGDVNPNGGGISLGHPLGATGARITATLVSELERRNARYGIAAMCIGFGQAIAGVVERV